MENTLAIILAGGQGTRLYDLTMNNAKPAVEFGSRYKIIDFTLTNCTHSNIKNVGLITQYQPLLLNKHVGNGSSWDLNSQDSGVTVLPPYTTSSDNKWFKGTAHAVHANMHYVDLHDPKYVLVLSGDHIYNMDYRKLIKFHEENNSDLTIAVMQVDISEASRFGIMNTDNNNKITEFEEKPKNPKSTLASMGIYVFSKEILKTYLKNEETREETEFDFGGDIIPQIINDNNNVMAYQFDGYWKDVGTISSLWEANMDLLKDDSIIDNVNWPIYSKNKHLNPTYLDNTAVINSASIGENCVISGVIKSSVISNNVVIKNEAIISNSVVHNNCIIKENVSLDYCVVKEGTTVSKNTVIKGSKDNIILVTEKTIKEYNGK